MKQKRELELIELLQREVKPALGCTEPIAVALAVTKAAEILRESGREVERVELSVSANILKNGMGVGVPGTGMVGLYIAAALGLSCGKSKYGLEVLKELDESSIEVAKQFVEQERVAIALSDNEKKLYIVAKVLSGEDWAEVIIEDDHDKITSIKLSQNEELQNFKLDRGIEGEESNGEGRNILDYRLTLEEIYNFSKEISFNQIEFILESVSLNRALSNEGLTNDYGLRVGKTIQKSDNRESFGEGFLSYSMALTAAASDARMAGSTLPAMSNSGSGNQGITATMPVIAYADKSGASEESLARALILSHLVAIHIKGHLGRLSALCGCVVASTGASCGIVYLKGGELKQMEYAIKNMIGNITGMVCDGAKVGCALKVASGVSSAVQASILAMENICISSMDGIIEEDIEKTIQNLCKIGSKGMENTDSMILDIMVGK